jgi:signal peptide peptidase SppA
MKLLDILTSPWAIQPEKLLEIQAIYATHLRGEKIDIAAVEKRLGKPLANERAPYENRDGVAVIALHGVIAKRMNLFAQISGGVSTELAARDLADAIADPAVHSIILHMDSPGGTADGTQALARTVMAARDAGKPIVAWADGVMASAAYWIGSAAARVYMADGTTQVGSIGVVASHTDVSGWEAQRGVKTTEIYAGQYKRIASNYAPLSADGKQSIQDQVDYLYAVFVADVAAQRGVSVDTVLNSMADGRIFIGQQAIDAGLVDGVSTLDALVADLNRSRLQGGPDFAARADVRTNTTDVPLILSGDVMKITKETLAAEAPELLAAIQTDAHALGRAEGLAAGAQAERERIQAVENQLIPGHETLIAALKFDGKTSGAEAAVQVLAAEKTLRGTALAQLRGDAPNPAAAPAAPSNAPVAEDHTLPLEDRARAKWDTDPKLRGEFSSFKNYLAYTRADAAGKIRVLGRKSA